MTDVTTFPFPPMPPHDPKRARRVTVWTLVVFLVGWLATTVSADLKGMRKDHSEQQHYLHAICVLLAGNDQQKLQLCAPPRREEE